MPSVLGRSERDGLPHKHPNPRDLCEGNEENLLDASVSKETSDVNKEAAFMSKWDRNTADPPLIFLFTLHVPLTTIHCFYFRSV